jgi:hypothetical protein
MRNYLKRLKAVIANSYYVGRGRSLVKEDIHNKLKVVDPVLSYFDGLYNKEKVKAELKKLKDETITYYKNIPRSQFKKPGKTAKNPALIHKIKGVIGGIKGGLGYTYLKNIRDKDTRQIIGKKLRLGTAAGTVGVGGGAVGTYSYMNKKNKKNKKNIFSYKKNKKGY